MKFLYRVFQSFPNTVAYTLLGVVVGEDVVLVQKKKSLEILLYDCVEILLRCHN